MEERKVKISDGREFVIKEVKYKDFAESIAEGKETSVNFLFKMATEITDEEYNALSMKDGIELQKAINEVNGLTNVFLLDTPLEKK